MSSTSLIAFLEKLDVEMSKKSKAYRKYTSDIKPHTFYLSKKGLKNQVNYQLQRDGIEIKAAEINKVITKYFNNLKAAFTGKTYGVIVHNMKITSVSFTVTISPEEDHKEFFTHQDSFRLLHALISNSKRQFNTSMKKLYKDQGKGFNEQAFLDIGHDKNSAVWDNRVSDALLEHGEPLTGAQTDIKEVVALFKLIKDDKTDSVKVSLESAGGNRSHGAKVLKKKKKKFQETLRKALQKLDAVNLDGSDSLVEKKRKLVLIKTLKPFEGKKNIKTTKAPKLKPSKKTPKKNSLTRNIKTASAGIRAAKAIRRKKSSPTSQPLQMLVLINKELPKTVMDNMGPPRLENQTGRFARSVRAVDVVKTPQGFPSIGYTYQRDPYQVFEEGSSGAWADGHRDPRQLIDASIREIAAKMAIGRFYTRRV